MNVTPLQDVLNYFSNYNTAHRAFELPEPSVVASRRILVVTCGAAGILRCGDYAAYHKTCKDNAGRGDDVLSGLEFSHVLIDEAGQVGHARCHRGPLAQPLSWFLALGAILAHGDNLKT